MEYSGIINPLDLKTIFVDYFAGSIEIFSVIGVLLLGVIAHKFKMNTTIFLTLASVFLIIVAIKSGITIMMMLIVLLIVGFLLARLIEK